ncbi:MAG: hypothetical protein HY961_19970 [Ignavibacteriae bacterium]|nr:hypothetical protein [Ignavibacteriota bacterium]
MNVNEIRPHIPSPTLPKPAQKNAKGTFDESLNSAAATASPQAQETPAALTSSEREYFEHLFPEASQSVRSYNPCRRDGVKEPATLGTIVDRKG